MSDWTHGPAITDPREKARTPLERLGDAALIAVEKLNVEGVEVIVLLHDANVPDADPSSAAIAMLGIESPEDALARLFHAAHVLMRIQGISDEQAREVFDAMLRVGP